MFQISRLRLSIFAVLVFSRLRLKYTQRLFNIASNTQHTFLVRNASLVLIAIRHIAFYARCLG